MIRLEKVTFYYPHSRQPAIRNLSLQIPEGSFVAVVGANGAGKSTLGALIAGFAPHHTHGHVEGRIVVDGLNTVETPLEELVRHVGMVFQSPLNQLSGAKLTVAEEVAFGLENLGLPREDMHRKVKEILDLMRLSDLANRSPFGLSGGEMQRVALASIIVMEPKVLVLDEPTASLDSSGTRELFAALHSLVMTRRCTVVLVEQKTEWVAHFADRVIVLREGAVILDGDPRTVLTSSILEEVGVQPTRYTMAARAARSRGLWPQDWPLPATLEDAVIPFETIQRQDS